MSDTAKITRDQWRELAKEVARAETPKRKLTYIGQRGSVKEHQLYVAGTPYELAYQNDPDNQVSPLTPVTVTEYQESLFSTTELIQVVSFDEEAPAPEVVAFARAYRGLNSDETPAPAAEVVANEISAETPKPVNPSLPVREILHKAVNIPLPVTKTKKNYKSMMPNGRNAKGLPDFKNWFGRVYPVNITYPAWKILSKSATDIANICIAKHDHAAHCKKKDSTGFPVIEFPFSEAVNFFRISRPTFDKSIKQLVEIGFIEYSSHGGIVNGHGVKARYRLSEKWKSWSPTETKVQNQGDIKKLNILATKQKPSKPVLHEAVNIPLPAGA